jgi:hypothetical protein
MNQLYSLIYEDNYELLSNEFVDVPFINCYKNLGKTTTLDDLVKCIHACLIMLEQKQIEYTEDKDCNTEYLYNNTWKYPLLIESKAETAIQRIYKYRTGLISTLGRINNYLETH